jgi:hypothetical protein
MAHLVIPAPLRKPLRRLRIRCEYKPRLYARIAARGFRLKRVLTLPEKPLPNTTLYKLCHRLGYSFTRDPDRAAELAIWWEDATVRRPCPTLERIAPGRRVLNLRCRDISKRRVDAAHAEVLGYSLAVDPTAHEGPCVRKSDLNALHDGAIIQGPVADPDPGAVYQIVIDNRISDDVVEDLRLFVFGERIPLCFRFHRPLGRRFAPSDFAAYVCEPESVLSADEMGKLLQLCRRMGLDYGELDTLRDAGSGRLYVVDVNSTPFGPSLGILKNSDPDRVFRALYEPFLEMIGG